MPETQKNQLRNEKHWPLANLEGQGVTEGVCFQGSWERLIKINAGILNCTLSTCKN